MFDMWKPVFFFLCLTSLSVSLFAAPPLNTEAIRQARGENSAEAAGNARLTLIAEAEKYQGVPYRYGGIDRKGFDCSGLIYRSFQDALSVAVPRTTTALYNWSERIDTGKLQPGDLVFFATLPSNKRGISHAGIYAGNGRFIHAASEGPRTGVIYSRLDEDYWQRTFVAAGRALPESSTVARDLQAIASSAIPPPGPAASVSPAVESGSLPLPLRPGTGDGTVPPAGETGESWRDKLVLGVGFAPTWNGMLSGGNIIRGGSFQGRIAWKGSLSGQSFMPGIELRPEWDNTLGVFHIPLTFSLGLDDRFRVFAGPAFSFGDPALQTKEGERSYTGGNSVIGTAGLTIAPFPINTGNGALSVYGELAWQSYFLKSGEGRNPNADLSAAFRISTGLRYSWGL
jgi:probable lipoprotein NlpC